MKSIFIFLLLILIHTPLPAQCDPGYTYFDTIPASVNIINGDSCFYTSDIDVLDALINENGLDYDSPLELGTQTWNNGRLKILVAGNYGNNSGVNDTIFVLPDSIGNWDELSALYLEWNRIAEIPASFSQLTNMQSLYISNNRIQSLPEDFDNLSNLYLLDAGYNELDSIPQSFCNLDNLTYLWLFNNELSTVPACICSLDINWSETDAAWYPYFAIGGNQLCNDVPACVANSDHFHISLDQFYYSFMVTDSQDCETSSTLYDHIPSSFVLHEPYPNPFNPATTIRFSAGKTDLLSLKVFDIKGRLVETLVEDVFAPGEYEIKWNASGHPSGIYFIQIKSKIFIKTRKIVLMK